MLISHALALAEARSCLAALADTSVNSDAGVEYGAVLLQLDELQGGVFPPITVMATSNREALFQVAQESISKLADDGVNPSEPGICLCVPVLAWESEHGPGVTPAVSCFEVRSPPAHPSQRPCHRSSGRH